MSKNFEETDYKRKQNMYSIMGIIGDILFYPIIIITLLCCFTIFSDKQAGKAPSILGISLVSIKSGSMTNAGFNVKDVVILKASSGDKLRAGDIIGFYYVFDNTCDADVNLGTLKLIQTYDRLAKTSDTFDTETFNEYRDNERVGERKSIDKVASKTNMYFHRIVKVFIKDDGTVFYQTQGDGTPNNPSNSGPDGKLICEDYVIGNYVYTPPIFRGFFSFVATSTGIVILVILPLSILMLFILFSIIEQISKMTIERKVLGRSIKYNSEESINANIGFDMEVPDKAWFYATSEQDQRNGVATFLWGYLKNGNEKQVSEYNTIMSILKTLETNPQKYWLYFQNTVKGKLKKKAVKRAWEDWSSEQELENKFIYLKKKREKEIKEKTNTKEEKVVVDDKEKTDEVESKIQKDVNKQKIQVNKKKKE